jgi:hypothetical protein
MAFNIKSTKDLANMSYVNAIIYGMSGIGKTVLCSTAPSPIILNAERGLLSLAGKDIASAEINSLQDMQEAFQFLKKGDHEFKSVCIDSISEIAEKILVEYKQEERDPRAAYGRMADEIIAIVRRFKELPMHVFFIAKQGRIEDAFSGKTNYGPSYPGQVLSQNLSYHLDLVLAMRIGKHEGNEYRYLQAKADIQYEAKDRSGRLDAKEKPDLSIIVDKIKSEIN